MRRITVTLFALWMAVSLTEPFQKHTCSVHDRIPGAPATTAHEHHGADPSPETDDSAAACHCLGSCCTSAPVQTALGHDVFGALAVHFRTIRPEPTTVPLTRVAFVLPYALAPPSLLS